MTTEKRCSACKRLLPADSVHWHRNGATRDGWHTQCRDCRREREAERARTLYREDEGVRGRSQAYSRGYYRRHQDRLRAKARRRYHEQKAAA